MLFLESSRKLAESCSTVQHIMMTCTPVFQSLLLSKYCHSWTKCTSKNLDKDVLRDIDIMTASLHQYIIQKLNISDIMSVLGTIRINVHWDAIEQASSMMMIRTPLYIRTNL